MSQFRKKQVVIDAIQWAGDNLAQIIEFTDGRKPDVKHDFAAMKWDEYCDLVARDGLKIFTLEGKMNAAVGDWIIRGVKGEFYPCKPEIFAMTYEPAATLPAAPAPTLSYTKSQLKMIERAIVGLRDGWLTRKDADDALAILGSAFAPTPTEQAAEQAAEQAELPPRPYVWKYREHFTFAELQDYARAALAARQAPTGSLTEAQIRTIKFAADALEGLDCEDTAGDLRAIAQEKAQ